MDITVFCDSPNHPFLKIIGDWILSENSRIKLITDRNKLTGGEYLLLVSCNQILKKDVVSRYQHTLVMHASDLPRGRGWSPYVWQILEGKNELTLSLLVAEDDVDTGDIWHKIPVLISESDLFADINIKIFGAHIDMIKWLIESGGSITSYKQVGDSSYYKKRGPLDSEIDTSDTIINQFNLLRVCDPDRYPAYFYHKGEKFLLKIEKVPL